MSWRLKPLHAPLPLAGRLVRVLGAIIEIPMLPVFDTGEHLRASAAPSLFSLSVTSTRGLYWHPP